MMELTPWRPFGDIDRMRRDIDDLWRRFAGGSVLDTAASFWMPSVDISETDDAFVVKAELPGLNPDDVNLDISGDILTIRGEKKEEREEEKESFYSRERYFGSFQRAIQLPSGVNRDTVDATFKKGVLSITLPKAEESKRKRIEVKTR